MYHTTALLMEIIPSYLELCMSYNSGLAPAKNRQYGQVKVNYHDRHGR